MPSIKMFIEKKLITITLIHISWIFSKPQNKIKIITNIKTQFLRFEHTKNTKKN